MSIINRDKDLSERRQERLVKLTGTVTGSSSVLMVAPFNAKIVGAFQAARGLSGSPVHTLVAERFIAGSGATVIGGWAATLSVTAFGTSGSQGYSCPAASFLTINAGDIISLYPSGTNAACSEVVIGVVLEALDDIKKSFSVPAL
jgi:hypothetical protein